VFVMSVLFARGRGSKIRDVIKYTIKFAYELFSIGVGLSFVVKHVVA